MNRPIAFSGSHSDITRWSKQFGIPSHEARQRYAELSILGCIGFDRQASRSIVLKGGNALRFAYGGTRSTIDLDFTAVQEALEDEGEVLRELFNQAFSGSETSFQIRLRCQRVNRRPRDGTGTHPTYDELLSKVVFSLRVEKGGVFRDELVTHESFQAHFRKHATRESR